MLSEYCKADMERRGQDPKVLKPLEKKLLSVGGKVVVCCYEEDLEKLLTRGQVFTPKKVNYKRMRRSGCHANAGIFWNNYSKEHGTDSVKIVVGWGLTERDQYWRQHSFIYLPKENKIIETTEKRQIYFGFILTEDEAEKHYFNNY
jgi:hypothetical protein